MGAVLPVAGNLSKGNWPNSSRAVYKTDREAAVKKGTVGPGTDKKINVLAMQNEESKPQSLRPRVSPFD